MLFYKHQIIVHQLGNALNDIWGISHSKKRVKEWANFNLMPNDISINDINLVDF